MLHRPSSLQPQAIAWPSLLRSTVCLSPPDTWQYDMPSSKGGILHCPAEFKPQATASPSLLRSTVCHFPADAIVPWVRKKGVFAPFGFELKVRRVKIMKIKTKGENKTTIKTTFLCFVQCLLCFTMEVAMKLPIYIYM